MRTKPLMLDFLDQNILKEIAAWLAPDPDRKNTLPNIKIRDELLAYVCRALRFLPPSLL